MSNPACPECGSENLTAVVLAYGRPKHAEGGLLKVPSDNIGHINDDAARITCDDCSFQAGQVRINWPATKHFKD